MPVLILVNGHQRRSYRSKEKKSQVAHRSWCKTSSGWFALE